MYKTFYAALLAALAVVLVSVSFPGTAVAQTSNGQVAAAQAYDEEGRPITTAVVQLSAEQLAAGPNFYRQMGFREVFPGFWLTDVQYREMLAGQSTGGPDGLFAELRDDMDGRSDRQWGSRWANRRLDNYITSGSQAWLLTAMPTSMRFTIYDQAVNRNQNVKCWTDIPPGPVVQLVFSCVDTKNGAQVLGDTISGIMRAFVPLAGATVLANVTARDGGDTIIESSSAALSRNAVNAGASAGARAESGYNPGNPYGYNPGSDDNQY